MIGKPVDWARTSSKATSVLLQMLILLNKETGRLWSCLYRMAIGLRMIDLQHLIKEKSIHVRYFYVFSGLPATLISA